MSNKTENESRNIFQKIEFFLFHLCLTVLMQSMLVSGYLNSINTTIERRYKMTTKEIGYIYMSYELSCIPTTVFLSLIGHRLNRSRFIGIAGILMTIGIFLFSLPHFIGSNYHLVICDENSTIALCNKSLEKNKTDCSDKTPDTWALSIFCIAQLLIGIGASPIYVLGPTYLWDNLSDKKYSIYSSIFYTFGGIGPPVGFVLGGLFLSLYIDSPISPKCKNMNTNHPLWLGAWWIGLIFIASTTILFVLPLLKFPKSIVRNQKTNHPSPQSSETNVQSPNKRNVGIECITGDIISYNVPINSNLENKNPSKLTRTRIPNWLYELKTLFSNPIWLLMSLTTVMEQSIVQACTTYISKYLQVVFNVPAHHASFVVGSVVVPGAISGVLFGGVLMHKFQPSQNNAIKGMIFLISITGILTLVLMFLGCNDLHVAGVSIDYNNITSNRKLNLISDCNSACNCAIQNYEPVCNSKESKNYYSPCYAGCKTLSSKLSDKRHYMDCSCSLSNTLSVGKCEPFCPTYYISLVIVFFQVFLTASGQIPVNIVTLKSVSVRKSSMALGVQVFMVRLFAFIPVPLYFGALFDHACLIRVTDICTKGSICHEYNLSILPFIWLGTVAAIKLINFTLIVSTYICIKEAKTPIFNETTIRISKVKESCKIEDENHNNTKTLPDLIEKSQRKIKYYPSEIDRFLCFNSIEILYGCCNRKLKKTNFIN